MCVECLGYVCQMCKGQDMKVCPGCSTEFPEVSKMMPEMLIKILNKLLVKCTLASCPGKNKIETYKNYQE